MDWLKCLFRPKQTKRTFTRMVRISGCLAAHDSQGQARELEYQTDRAIRHLYKDLEHAARVKITDLARTGDDLKRVISLEIDLNAQA